MQIGHRPLAPGETDHELLWLTASLGGLAAAATWFALQLPWPACLFHMITGHPCATCGATRSALAFFQGHLFSAFRWNPLAFLFYCGLTIFDVYAFSVLVFRKPRLRISWSPKEKRLARYSVIVLLALNWTYLLVANRSL